MAHSEETKKRISESMMGNSNRLVHGEYSKRLAVIQPVRCDTTCALYGQCPHQVEQSGSICPLNDEFMALGRQLGDVYDHSELVAFITSIIQLNSFRLSRATFQEQILDGGAIDPEVSRLASSVIGDSMRLARLLGFTRTAPNVLIDNRRQNLTIDARVMADNMSDQEYMDALGALSTLRRIDPQLPERLIDAESE